MKAALLVLFVAFVGIALSSVVSLEEQVHYDGYQVVRALIDTKAKFSRAASLQLDVWSGSDGSLGYGLVDLMVNASDLAALDSSQIKYTVMIKDVEQLIQDQKFTTQEVLGYHDSYHTFDEIVSFLRNNSLSSPLVTYTTIGTSVGGRLIPAITITAGSATNKKRIFFEGGQHAREWIAPATVLYIVDQLLAEYGKVAAVTRLLDNAIFYVVPLVNPDGYEYSRTTNRNWRKNRRANTGGSYGVDLNRNWDDHWGGQGSSGIPTDDTYRGTAPFSEPESLAVSRFINSNGPFQGAIDYHSYSQLVLRPYGWSSSLPPNEATAKSIGDAIALSIRNNGGKVYTSQPSWQLYYTTGSSQDWWYGQAKIPLSYTIELRDTGTYGFLLPANQIIPTGVENYAAFLQFATTILNS